MTFIILIKNYFFQADCEQSEAARQAEARRKQIYKKKAQIQATRSMMMRISSPPPVPGRKHEPVQTDLYLEEVNIIFIYLNNLKNLQ